MKPQEQQRDEVQAERTAFIGWMRTVDPARVRVVDESGLVRGMRLGYGYSERGERCYDAAPLSRGKRLSLVGWIGLDGSGCVATQASTINQPLFRGFILEHLVPTLEPGDVVVWTTTASMMPKACASRSKRAVRAWWRCRATARI